MKLPNRVSVALIVVATTALFTPEQAWGELAPPAHAAAVSTLTRAAAAPPHVQWLLQQNARSCDEH